LPGKKRVQVHYAHTIWHVISIFFLKRKVFKTDCGLNRLSLGFKKMSVQNEERRIRGIAKQIGLLKCEIRKENRKNTLFFLVGLTVGLLSNVLIEMLIL